MSVWMVTVSDRDDLGVELKQSGQMAVRCLV
jgi:hypothetical protein